LIGVNPDTVVEVIRMNVERVKQEQMQKEEETSREVDETAGASITAAQRLDEALGS